MKLNSKLYIFGLLLCGFLFFSCSAERHSVFHAVITDREEVDSSLDNSLSIVGMADDGTDYYVAAAGTLWKRAISDNASSSAVEWSSVTMPASAVLCTALGDNSSAPGAGDGTSLYGGFMLSDNSFAMYTGSYGADPGWTLVSDAAISGKQVLDFFYENLNLFISLKNGSAYELYYYDGAYNATSLPALTSPVTCVIYDGSNYWAVTKDKVYKDGAATLGTELTTVPAKDASDGYQSVYYSSAQGAHFLSLNNGYVYASSDGGGTWPSNSSHITTSTDIDIYFTSIAEVESNIIIGTLNNGFYQTKTGDITALSVHEDELVSDINSSSVLDFYVDNNNGVVFFMTGGYGLYRNSYTDAGGWSGLTHE